jgi:photosystem II stability/assembly factor-like uncharacterized protein
VNVTALFVSGADIFAGTQQDGLFRSTDRGLSWTKTNLPASIVFSFAANDESLFVGLFDGIYRSTDQGRSWTKADAGLPPEVNARALAISGSHLLAGTFAGRIYRSTDQGQSWADLTSRMGEQTRVNALAVSGTTLFAGTVCGVLRSTDQGQSWETVNAGLTSASIEVKVGEKSIRAWRSHSSTHSP